MESGLREVMILRIDRINLGVDTDENGMVRSASVYFENVSEIGERISGNFGITVEQYNKVQNKEISIREIAEAKVIELFQIKPDQDAMAGVVELRNQLKEKDEIIQGLKEQIDAQTMMITELTLLISNLGMGEIPAPEEESDEETNNENTDTNPTENGGQGGE